jgi:hypothetical protein
MKENSETKHRGKTNGRDKRRQESRNNEKILNSKKKRRNK